MAIALRLPNTLFWIPTRAWRNAEMLRCIQDYILPTPNIRVICSIDPSTSEDEIDYLRAHGVSLVFTGDNENSNQMMLTFGDCADKLTARMKRCRKTWDTAKGYCAVCNDGCFAEGRVEVHLRYHK
jgi:hypothetical protein